MKRMLHAAFMERVYWNPELLLGTEAPGLTLNGMYVLFFLPSLYASVLKSVQHCNRMSTAYGSIERENGTCTCRKLVISATACAEC